MPPVNFLFDFGLHAARFGSLLVHPLPPSRLAAAAPPTSKVPSACWHSTPWWLNPRGGLDRLFARVGRVGVPIAVAMEHSAEPLAVTRTMRGMLALLDVGPVIQLRCDASGIACFHGAWAAAAGTLTVCATFTPSQRPVAADRRFAVPGLLHLLHLPHLQGARVLRPPGIAAPGKSCTWDTIGEGYRRRPQGPRPSTPPPYGVVERLANGSVLRFAE